MKILMLTPQEFFSKTGTPFSVLYRLKALSKLGYHIDVLTYHMGKNVKIDNVEIYRIPKVFFIKKIPIGPSLTKLILDIILFFRAFKILCQNHYNCLHVHEEAVYMGMIFKKVFKIPLVYDMHSSIPEQLSHNKSRFYNNRISVSLAECLEKLALRISNQVIVICPYLLKIVNKIYPSKKYTLIENCVSDIDCSKVSENEKERLKKELGLDDNCKIIVYIGTIEHYQGIDLLIKGIPFVLKKSKQIRYLIVGGWSHQIKEFRNLAERVGVTGNIIFTGQKEQEEIPCYLAIADILVSPRSEGTNTPLKIYDYLRADKPIVVTNLLTHTQILNERVAILTKPDSEAFAKGIIRALENQNLSINLTKSAKKLADTKYTFENYLSQIKKVYEKQS
jgi:glycosyltransferase involved in cell wall biosynthesis